MMIRRACYIGLLAWRIALRSGSDGWIGDGYIYLSLCLMRSSKGLMISLYQTEGLPPPKFGCLNVYALLVRESLLVSFLLASDT